MINHDNHCHDNCHCHDSHCPPKPPVNPPKSIVTCYDANNKQIPCPEEVVKCHSPENYKPCPTCPPIIIQLTAPTTPTPPEQGVCPECPTCPTCPNPTTPSFYVYVSNRFMPQSLLPGTEKLYFRDALASSGTDVSHPLDANQVNTDFTINKGGQYKISYQACTYIDTYYDSQSDIALTVDVVAQDTLGNTTVLDTLDFTTVPGVVYSNEVLAKQFTTTLAPNTIVYMQYTLTSPTDLINNETGYVMMDSEAIVFQYLGE
ncbi:MAG: hypothetical protein FWH20_07195 [Oscillospiraceae bacterium]|nr:hypothetical protein [Oscillospiraceae bacterium]